MKKNDWRTREREWRLLLGMKLCTTFYRRMILLAYTLNVANPVVIRPRIAVEIAQLTELDIDAYATFRPDQSRAEIQARLTRQDRCFACWYEGRIVDAGWVASGRVYIPYLRQHITLCSGDIYNYDSYTLPEFRNQRLYMSRNTFIGKLNQDEGFTRSLALVAAENKTPNLVLRMYGLKPIGLYSCVRFGRWQKIWQQSYSDAVLPVMS